MDNLSHTINIDSIKAITTYMLTFTFFTAVRTRELTGVILKNKYLNTLKEQACQMCTDSQKLAKSLRRLQKASDADCPYSNFVLACLYLGREIRNPFKDEKGNEWYNLFNGFIRQTYHDNNDSHLINLTWLESIVSPNITKAIHYFRRSAMLNNSQAWLWLTRLASSAVPGLPCNPQQVEYYLDQTVNVMNPDKFIYTRQFELDDIIYLASKSARFARQLLVTEKDDILHYIDPEKIDRSACDHVADILASGYEVAKEF